MSDRLTFWRRGKLTLDADKCNYCGLCARRCPHRSLKVDVKNRMWKLRGMCMRCGRCIRECPMQALSLVKDENK